MGDTCGACGAATRPGLHFCEQCGSPLEDEAQVGAGRPLGGFWRRFCAYAIDGAVLMALYLAGARNAVLELVISALYWCGTVGAWQQSLGMKILGLKVVPSDGRMGVSLGDAVVRWLMMLLGSLCLGLGFLWAAWDTRRQTWHDRVAKTLVVRV